jgi:chemotaxis protein MotB
MGHPTANRALTALAIGGTLALLASCVSKAKYDEALAEIKFYQRSNQDLRSFQGTLEAENEMLKGEMALGGQPTEASLNEDIDVRLEELRQIMEGIGAAPGDVEIISIDGGYGLRLSDAILFDSGSATIKPAGRELLLTMAAEINTKPFARLWIRGHTDSDPVKKAETRKRFPHGNLELSAARAIQVAVLLGGEGGVAKDKIVVAGFGAGAPVVPNSSRDNKRRNRRVEIFVLDEGAEGSE